MCKTDVGDYTDIRLADGCKFMHLSEMVNSHLQDSDFMFFGKIEDGKRKSDSIVKVSLCLKNIVFPGKDRGNRFFGAGLANTSGDADNLDVKLHAVKRCNITKCFFAGFYMNAGTGKGRRIFFCKSSKCTLFHNLWDKGVAVYSGSFEWNKKKSRCCFPAVDCNAGNLFFKKTAVTMEGSMAGSGYIF